MLVMGRARIAELPPSGMLPRPLGPEHCQTAVLLAAQLPTLSSSSGDPLAPGRAPHSRAATEPRGVLKAALMLPLSSGMAPI